MFTVERLQQEHAEVIRWLETFDKEVGNLMLGQMLDGAEALRGMARFIEKTVLPHLSSEEKAIFPLLVQGAAQDRGLREELLAQHLALRDAFFSYLAETRGGRVTRQLLDVAHDVSRGLRDHARKEEQYLIPAFRRYLVATSGGPAPAPSFLVAPGLIPGVQVPGVQVPPPEALEVVRRSTLFSTLAEAQISSIAALGSWREHPKDEVVAREGELFTTLSIVAQGCVAAIRTVHARSGPIDFTSALMNVGEVLGMAALIDPYRSNASARCLTPTRFLTMEAEAVRSLLEGDQGMAARVMKQLAIVYRGRLSSTIRALGQNL